MNLEPEPEPEVAVLVAVLCLFGAVVSVCASVGAVVIAGWIVGLLVPPPP